MLIQIRKQERGSRAQPTSRELAGAGSGGGGARGVREQGPCWKCLAVQVEVGSGGVLTATFFTDYFFGNVYKVFDSEPYYRTLR